MQKSILTGILLFIAAIGVFKHNLYPFKFDRNSSRFKPLKSSSSPAAQLRSSLHTLNEVFDKWNFWKIQFNKQYASSEEPIRYKNFQNNYQYIKNHNNNSTHKYKLAVNQFADLTGAEFASQQLGAYLQNVQINPPTTLNTSNLSQTLDWREMGVVTSIKNQGQCESCWAFSACAGLEALNVLYGGNLTSYSPQQLVDCSSSFENQGCSGGNYVLAWEYVEQYGVENWDSYEYTGVVGNCSYNQNLVEFGNTGYITVEENDPLQLMAAVNINPTSVGIEADSTDFQFYANGTFDSEGCGTSIDHAVIVVGYNYDVNGTLYWIVKNSWGVDWGDNGYVHIEASDGAGVCGINQAPAFPTLSNNSSSS